MNVIPAFFEKQSLILIGINRDRVVNFWLVGFRREGRIEHLDLIEY